MAGPGFFFAIEKRSHLVPSRANWIESHADLRNHPKLKSTADELGISTAQLCGHLHFLWHWCIDYQEDGDVTRYSPEIIASAAGWSGDGNQFVTALTNGYWLDSGPKRTIHNWDEYAGRLLKRRADIRANVARFREKQRGNQDTVPNRTQPYRTKEEIHPPNPPEGGESFKSSNGNGSHPTRRVRVNRQVFVRPTLDEVRAFIEENQYDVDPEQWYAHYESNGWRVGKNPMVRWKAAVHTWQRQRSSM